MTQNTSHETLAQAISDNNLSQNAGSQAEILIGQLLLLPALYIKPNQPLINNITGELEIVDKNKFFSENTHSRYYIITEDEPTDKNLIFAYNVGTNKGQILMYSDYQKEDGDEYHVCYPAANSIVERLHNMYYASVILGNVEYIRFTKIHGGKYAGFPLGNKIRISQYEASRRWTHIFQYILETIPTSIKKKKIGVLFGTIAGAELSDINVINTLFKYKSWIVN